MSEYIDMTPTWSAMTPIMLHAIENGTMEDSKKALREEIGRMAKLADLWVAHCKEESKNES